MAEDAMLGRPMAQGAGTGERKGWLIGRRHVIFCVGDGEQTEYS